MRIDSGHDELVRRWQLVRVKGPSMVPTVMSGDVLLVRRFGPGPRVGADSRVANGGAGGEVAGSVVVGRFRSLPATLVVKRAEAMRGDGWVLRSDNPFVGGDSAAHGIADVEGRVVLRWRPGVGSPRRIAAAPDVQATIEGE